MKLNIYFPAQVRLYSLWGPPQPGDLKRIVRWGRHQDEGQEAVAKRPHCGTCGHPGTVGQHTREGLKAGLALKNPPRKPTQKNPPKKPTKMFFFGFF